MMRARVLAVGWGMGGVALALLLWHLWMDHVSLHQIIGLINANSVKTAAVETAR